jgi:pimeloyl-ACP methyl ester carboxylesterase
MPYIQLGPKRIHYTDLKPENGDPRATFVCVHGLGSSQDYYHAVAQTLQANNFRCITFDTHGSGRSSYTFIEQNISSLAADVIGLMDALDVSKAVVLGHSMGGCVWFLFRHVAN